MFDESPKTPPDDGLPDLVQPTMADLIDNVLSDGDLAESRRRNLASSIRRFCKALELAPSDAPAAFAFFRSRIAKFHPLAKGFTKHRWQTICSDVRFALNRFLGDEGARPRRPFTDAQWQALRVRSREDAFKWGLHRFARFCDTQRVPPDRVDDSTFDAFHRYLVEETFKVKPERQHRDACRLWNTLGARYPEFGLKRVSPPRYRETYTQPWNDLPKHLTKQADAWLRFLSEEGDILSDEAPDRVLRPASVKAYRFSIRQILGALEQRGQDLSMMTSLEDVTDLKTAKAALDFLLDRNNREGSSQIHNVANVLVLLAKYYTVPPSVLDKLKGYRKRVAPKHRGMKPRPAATRRQFHDTRNIAKVLQLPVSIYDRLRRKNTHDLRDARLMQVAIMVELELMRPIRRSNLGNLRLGEHILERGNRTLIVIDESEVKNGYPLDYTIPPESARMLHFYTEKLLPLFGPNPERFLFPGQVPGKSKSHEQLGRQFKKGILDATGLQVYPHFMRHFGALLYLRENPGHFDIVRRVLGHRSLDTTARAYAQLDDEEAVKKYQELLGSIRIEFLKEDK